MSLKLSAHFDQSEIFPGGVLGASKLNVLKARYLCLLLLEPMRELAGVPLRITSGYRTPQHNAEVGGAENSDHLYRDLSAAADFKIVALNPTGVAPGRDNALLLKWAAEALRPAFGQLIGYMAGPGALAWIHVGIPTERHHGEVLLTTVEKPRTYRPYTGVIAL